MPHGKETMYSKVGEITADVTDMEMESHCNNENTVSCQKVTLFRYDVSLLSHLLWERLRGAITYQANPGAGGRSGV